LEWNALTTYGGPVVTSWVSYGGQIYYSINDVATKQPNAPGTPGALDYWKIFVSSVSTPDAVLSVNGNKPNTKTGNVTIDKTDIGLGDVKNIDATNPRNIDEFENMSAPAGHHTGKTIVSVADTKSWIKRDELPTSSPANLVSSKAATTMYNVPIFAQDSTIGGPVAIQNGFPINNYTHGSIALLEQQPASSGGGITFPSELIPNFPINNVKVFTSINTLRASGALPGDMSILQLIDGGSTSSDAITFYICKKYIPDTGIPSGAALGTYYGEMIIPLGIQEINGKGQNTSIVTLNTSDIQVPPGGDNLYMTQAEKTTITTNSNKIGYTTSIGKRGAVGTKPIDLTTAPVKNSILICDGTNTKWEAKDFFMITNN